MIKVYGRSECIYCEKVCDLLKDYDYEFSYLDVELPDNMVHKQELKKRGLATVPQVDMGDGIFRNYTDTKYYLGNKRLTWLE